VELGAMVRPIRSGLLVLGVTVAAIGLIASLASARPTTSPLGNWSTANGRGVIAIVPCGDALCGRIVGIDRKPMEPIPTDVRGRSQCGLTIITNQRLKADGTWLGEVTDPRDGDTYQAKLWLDNEGNLPCEGSSASRCLVRPRSGGHSPAV